jgi:hypothetical protein
MKALAANGKKRGAITFDRTGSKLSASVLAGAEQQLERL